MTLGPMEGVAETIAQSNRELAGFAQTRLTLPASEGDLIIAVESTFGWPDSGSIVLFGTVYTYAVRSLTTLEGLQWTDGATMYNGVRVDLVTETIVTDVSKATSAMDLLRRAMLVDTADGADLSTVGRNLGVDRLPFLRDDERFRELIKALAYNPRGTVYGLELVMTALVGAGNFEIFEDVVNQPNRVFIRLINEASLSAVSGGKMYLRGTENRPSDSASQVTITGSVVSQGEVTSIVLAPEDHLTDCRTQYPSADSFVEYTGGPTVYPWSVVGTNVVEGTHIIQVTPVTQENGAIEFTLSPPTDTSQYGHSIRAADKSNVEFTVLLTIPTGTSSEIPIWTGMSIDDGTRLGFVGVKALTGQFAVGFTTAGSTTFTGGAAFNPQGQFVEVMLRKVRDERWELYVDNELISTQAYASVAAGGTAQVLFGHYNTAAGNDMRVKQVGYRYRDPVDYWGINATDGSMTNPDILGSASSAFLSGDVGKQLITRDSANAINNGDWVIYQYDAANQVRVRGKTWVGRADLGEGATDRVVVDETNPQLFVYPDDIGKQIEVMNSSLGNDGTYTITDLLEPGTLTSFGTGYKTQNTERTNIAVVSGGPFTPENDVDWRLLPQFASATGVYWEMPGVGTEASGVLTLRSPSVLPHPVVVEVLYSEVLGGNLLFDATVLNTVLQQDPLLLEYYPFYLTDPIGFIRQYLDDVTAAGVIPDYDY